MHGLKVTSLLALVFLEVGCGLPSPYFLQSPSVTQLFGLSTPNCVIQNTGRANDYQANFEGFELFYKIFSSTNTTFDPTFVADQQYGTVSYTPSDLQSHGFRRVTLGPGTTSLPADTNAGSSSAPLININALDPLDIPSTFSISIFMNDSSATSLQNATKDAFPLSYYTYTPATGTYATIPIFQEIRRFLPVDPTLTSQPPIGLGQTCKPFARNIPSTLYSSDYLAADIDVGATVYTSSQTNNGSQLVIMFYAASYGHAGGQVVYSVPTYLGYTQFQALQ